MLHQQVERLRVQYVLLFTDKQLILCDHLHASQSRHYKTPNSMGPIMDETLLVTRL